jgi:hypothetical protein
VTDDTKQAPKDMIGFLDYYLVKKAPFQIPDPVREWLVKFGPWITVVLLALSLPLIFVVLGLGTMLMPFAGTGYAYGYGYGGYWVATLGLLVHVGLMVLALPGLFARKMSGWTWLFYAQVVSAVTSILAGSILGALVGALISFYILFQVRSLYKA